MENDQRRKRWEEFDKKHELRSDDEYGLPEYEHDDHIAWQEQMSKSDMIEMVLFVEPAPKGNAFDNFGGINIQKRFGKKGHSLNKAFQTTKVRVQNYRKPRCGRMTDAGVKPGDFILSLDFDPVGEMDEKKFNELWETCSIIKLLRKQSLKRQKISNNRRKSYYV